MIVNRKLLVDQLSMVLPATGTGPEGSSRVVFENNALSAYNGHIAIEVPCSMKDIACSVNASELTTILRRFDTAECDISLTEDKFIIKAGKAKASLKLFPIVHSSCLFLDRPTGIPFPSDYHDALATCHIPGNKHLLAGAFFSGTSAVSTDGMRINHVTLSEDTNKFWINDTAIKTILKYGNVFTQYAITDGHVWFRNDELVIAVNRLNDELYKIDKVKAYVETCKDVDTVYIPEGLYAVVQRSAPFTETEQSLQPIQLSFLPTGIYVAVDTAHGAYEEMVEFEDELPVAEETVRVDYAHLLYALKRSNAIGIKHIGDDRMLVLVSETGIVMLGTLGG